MKKRLSLVLAASLTLGLALTGCGGSKGTADTTAVGGADKGAAGAETSAAMGAQVDTAGFLVTVLNSDIQTADVQKTSKDYQTPMNIYDRLVDIEVDDAGVSKVVPSLAESWEISDDGLSLIHISDQGELD